MAADPVNLTNSWFGDWLVLWFYGVSPEGRTLWWCHCTCCGGSSAVWEHDLVQGRTTMCRDCVRRLFVDPYVRTDEIPDYEVRAPGKALPVGEVCEGCDMLPSVTGRCGCS